MKQNLKTKFTISLILLISVSCAPDGGGKYHSTPGVYPPNGEVIPSNQRFRMTISPEANKDKGALYSYGLYKDTLKKDTPSAKGGIHPQPDGSVIMDPGAEFLLYPDTQYWWEWNNTSNRGSGLLTFFTSAHMPGVPVSPRPGGYMDRNKRLFPEFAVSNVYNGTGLVPSYDFELYDNPSAQKPIAQITRLKQDSTGVITKFQPDIELADGATYYWRVKINAPGVRADWGQMNRFKVTDFCSLEGPPYASHVIHWAPGRCVNQLDFADPEEILGNVNADWMNYAGFVSIDYGGEIIVEMGATVVDNPGNDIQVHEVVSTEFLEVFAGASEAGPWVSLGAAFCHKYCEFDLALAGVRYTRYIKIKDLDSPSLYCHETSGADLDAVIWARPVSQPGACSSAWW